MERCEFSTGYGFDRTGKPMVVRCDQPGSWHKDKCIFGGGIYACDRCWQKWRTSCDVEEEADS